MSTGKVLLGGRPVPGFSIGVGATDTTSYEDAVNATASHLEKVDQYGHAAGSDLTDAQLLTPLAGVFPACGVPDRMKIVVKVAVKWGRAVGVTVETNPTDGRIASCVDRAIRKLSWPSSPRLDSFTTSY
jgi:hypothetical protein